MDLEWIPKYWVEFLFSVIIAIMTGVVHSCSNRIKTICEEYKSDQSEQKVIKAGLITLIGDRISQYYMSCIDHKYCPVESLRDITILYTHYSELGGQDEAVKSLFNSILNLPHTPPTEED